jgi:hypothetical protein
MLSLLLPRLFYKDNGKGGFFPKGVNFFRIKFFMMGKIYLTGNMFNIENKKCDL